MDDAALSDRSIHKLQQIRLWVVQVKVGGLASIHDRSTTDGDKDIRLVSLCKIDSILETLVGWFYASLVVHNVVDSVGLKRSDHGLHDGKFGDIGVRHDQDFFGIHVHQILTHFTGDAFTETHGRRGHLKGVLVVLVIGGRVVVVVTAFLSMVVMFAGVAGGGLLVLESTRVRVSRASTGPVHKRDQGLDRRLGVLSDSDSSGHGFFLVSNSILLRLTRVGDEKEEKMSKAEWRKSDGKMVLWEKSTRTELGRAVMTSIGSSSKDSGCPAHTLYAFARRSTEDEAIDLPQWIALCRPYRLHAAVEAEQLEDSMVALC